MTVVYVLECRKGKYYVGKTTNIKTRFQEHCNGDGADWTRKYEPIRIFKQYKQANNDKYLELNKTLEYMDKYGIKNVRGGPYCQVDLSAEVEQLIRRQLCSVNGKCYKCYN